MPLTDPTVTLQPHQQRLKDDAADAAASGVPFRRVVVWGTGTGKTTGSLAAADVLGGTTSVVTPAAVRPGFQREALRFFNRPDIPVVSYGQAANGKTPESNTLIVDEAHRLSSPTSTQAAAVSAQAARTRNLLAITGTPVRNSPVEFAPLMSLVTGQQITPDEFQDRFIGVERKRPGGILGWLRGEPVVEQPTLINKDELKSLLDGKVDYYHPEQPMVGTEEETHEVDMTPRQADLYHGFWGRLPLVLRWKLKHRYDLSPEEMGRLRAFSTGPRTVGISDHPYRNDGDARASFEHSGKLRKAHAEMRKVLDADPRTKGVIYTNFPGAAHPPLAAAFAHDSIPYDVFDGTLSDQQRKDVVDRFNTGKTRVLMLGPSATEGLNLKGAQLIQLLDPGWHESRMRQAMARVIRYDSHTNLPPELQRVKVQRFVSKLPLSLKDKMLASLGLIDPEPRTRTADHYLRDLSTRKERLNTQLIDVLREVSEHNRLAKTAADQLHAGDVLKLVKLAALTRESKAAAKRFHRPENYDKIRDLPGGRELWAGANDWEAGWTWAWVQHTGGDKSAEPAEWIEVDHSECPGCKGTGEDSSAKADSLCVKYGKLQVNRWAVGLVRKKTAVELVSYVPTAILPEVRRSGLYSGAALLRNPRLMALAAAGRGQTPEQFAGSIRGVLAGWKPDSAKGVNAVFAPPPETTALEDNHPLRRWDLTPVRILLDHLRADQPKTRVHGQELIPYAEYQTKWTPEQLATDQDDPTLRHRDLTDAELAALSTTTPVDLWKHYADPDRRGMYAPDVPHAAVITPSGRILPKYLKFPSFEKIASNLQELPLQDRLRLAKVYSDLGTPEGYAAKAELIRGAMKTAPHEWWVDSDTGHTLGVRHISGWRYHLPTRVISDIAPFLTRKIPNTPTAVTNA